MTVTEMRFATGLAKCTIHKYHREHNIGKLIDGELYFEESDVDKFVDLANASLNRKRRGQFGNSKSFLFGNGVKQKLS